MAECPFSIREVLGSSPNISIYIAKGLPDLMTPLKKTCKVSNSLIK